MRRKRIRATLHTLSQKSNWLVFLGGTLSPHPPGDIIGLLLPPPPLPSTLLGDINADDVLLLMHYEIDLLDLGQFVILSIFTSHGLTSPSLISPIW